MITVIILLCILFLIYEWKWVFFLILVPCLIIRNKKVSKENKKEISKFSSSTQNLYQEKLIKKIVNGFLRYISIQIGYIPSHAIRMFLYRNVFGANIEKKVVIYYGCEIRNYLNLSIGQGSIIGDKAILDARNGLRIGKNVNLSSNVSIYTEQHDYRDKEFKCNSDASFHVEIDDRVWIGPNVIILPKVHIGEGAVVAAGAVVTKNVESFSIVAGIPAKEIGKRTHNIDYSFDGKHSLFY